MYIERLLNDIGVDGTINYGLVFKKDNSSDYILNGKFIGYGGLDVNFDNLSDILIKNIDKIINIYEKEWRGEKTMFYPENIIIKLIEAIQNNTEEEFASSLYNNK